MQRSQTIDFLLGWLGCLSLYFIAWGLFAFFIPLLFVPHILAIIAFWKIRRYVSFGLLFAMLFVVIPVVFWDWWRESSIQYWFVRLGHSSLFDSISAAWWRFVDWLTDILRGK